MYVELLGDKIRSARMSTGYSQNKFAKESGFMQSRMSLYEKSNGEDTVRARYKTAMKLAEALDVHVDDISVAPSGKLRKAHDIKRTYKSREISDYSLKIARSIEALRLQNRKSQQEVADYLGISILRYARLESGATDLTVETMSKLCELFEQTPNYFMAVKDNDSTADNPPLSSFAEEIPCERLDWLSGHPIYVTSSYLSYNGWGLMSLDGKYLRIKDSNVKLRDIQINSEGTAKFYLLPPLTSIKLLGRGSPIKDIYAGYEKVWVEVLSDKGMLSYRNGWYRIIDNLAAVRDEEILDFMNYGINWIAFEKRW